MATKTLSLIPDTLDLALYAGDGASIKLTVTDNDAEPLPVEGEILAQIKKSRMDEEALLEFTANLVDGENGVVFISLTGEETASLITEKPKFTGVWDVQWHKPDNEPITLVQGKVECSVDVSR